MKVDKKKWLKVDGRRWKMEDNAQNRAMYIQFGKCDVDRCAFSAKTVGQRMKKKICWARLPRPSHLLGLLGFGLLGLGLLDEDVQHDDDQRRDVAGTIQNTEHMSIGCIIIKKRILPGWLVKLE